MQWLMSVWLAAQAGESESLWNQDWGSVPDWVAGFGTVAAVWYALVQGVNQRKREEQREVEQQRRRVAGVSVDQTLTKYHLQNSEGKPASDPFSFKALVRNQTGAAISNVYVFDRLGKKIVDVAPIPPGGEEPVAVLWDEDMGDPVIVRVHFNDIDGGGWDVDAEGKLYSCPVVH